MPAKKTDEQFIYAAKELHKNKYYDYSFVNYVNGGTKVIIVCPKHGLFEKSPECHLRGQGCKKCKYERLSLLYSSNANEFIEKSLIIHATKNYDYLKVKYRTAKTKVEIICPIHGSFWQTPTNHLSGLGCLPCGMIKSGNQKRKLQNDFIETASVIHLNKYTYFDSIYLGDSIKLTILCPLHGNFSQTPSNHLRGHGCPKCSASKGEIMIEQILQKYKVIYKTEHRISECRHKRPLPFDFAIYTDGKLIGLIEYQGHHHFRAVSIFGGDLNFENTQIRDTIKRTYCNSNNIPLLEIPFTEFSNLESILVDFLSPKVFINAKYSYADRKSLF